jgi:acyl-CoA synthetase (AMP-forming)/AMP-acid ligase II
MGEIREDLLRPLPILLGTADRDRAAFSDGARSVTYAELSETSALLATALGTARGDRVLLHVGGRVEYVEFLLAAVRAAAVGVPVSVRATEAEVAAVADDPGAVLLVTEARHAELARRLTASRPHLRVLFVEDTPPPGSGAPRDDLGLDDPAWLLYTSGTTGRPKGVLTTQRSVLWSTAAGYVPMFGLTQNDTILWPLPPHHAYALSLAVLGTIAVGAHTRFTERLSAEVLAEHPGCVLATYAALRQEIRGPVVRRACA